jgi:hypothetical protein
MNYKLHNKANDMFELHQAMKARIEKLESHTEYYSEFPKLKAKHLNGIDTCKRGLERIEQAYIKVLTEILAV